MMEKKYKNFLLYWFPIFIYCFLIYTQSSGPSPESIPELPYIDKLLHFAAYAVMGALFFRAFNNTLAIEKKLKVGLALSIILSGLYGISDEFHQSFVPFRDADVMDVMADICGAICGVIFYKKFWG